MSKSTTVKSQLRKKPGPAPTGKGEPIMVRLQPDMLAALERFASEHDGFNRPTTIRLILRDWLVGNGYLVREPLDTLAD